MPLVSSQEQQQLVFDWNDSATPIPRNVSMSQLFEAQAARTPEATALISGDAEMTPMKI